MSARHSIPRSFRATFSARDVELPTTVRVNGVYYRVEPVGTKNLEPGALPPDLLAGLNLAKAHINMACALLSVLGGTKPKTRPKQYYKGLHFDTKLEDPAWRVAYLVNEIECQNGAEVIRALPLPILYGSSYTIGPVAELNAHRAAYAAALQIAGEVKRGLPFSIVRRDLKRLLIDVEEEAWTAARPSKPLAELPSNLPAKTLSNDNLSEAEQSILEALGEQTLRGEKIAALAGYAPRTARGHLANLVRRGLLEKVRGGYRRPKAP